MRMMRMNLFSVCVKGEVLLIIRTSVLSLPISRQVQICRFAKPKVRPAVPRRWRSAIRWLHAATWSPACRLSALNSSVSSSRTLPYFKVSSLRTLSKPASDRQAQREKKTNNPNSSFKPITNNLQTRHFLGYTSQFVSAA